MAFSRNDKHNFVCYNAKNIYIYMYIPNSLKTHRRPCAYVVCKHTKLVKYSRVYKLSLEYLLSIVLHCNCNLHRY